MNTSILQKQIDAVKTAVRAKLKSIKAVRAIIKSAYLYRSPGKLDIPHDGEQYSEYFGQLAFSIVYKACLSDIYSLDSFPREISGESVESAARISARSFVAAYKASKLIVYDHNSGYSLRDDLDYYSPGNQWQLFPDDRDRIAVFIAKIAASFVFKEAFFSSWLEVDYEAKYSGRIRASAEFSALSYFVTYSNNFEFNRNADEYPFELCNHVREEPGVVIAKESAISGFGLAFNSYATPQYDKLLQFVGDASSLVDKNLSIIKNKRRKAASSLGTKEDV